VAVLGLTAAAPAQTSYYPPRPVPAPAYELAPMPRQPADAPPGYRKIYRLAANFADDHLYTPNASEAYSVAATGAYRNEAAVFYVFDRQYDGTVPLYRFLTPAGKHILSTDRFAGAAQGARLEAPIGYIDTRPRAGEVALHGWYNPATGGYFYTTDPSGELAPGGGMQYIGVIGYVTQL
jgi:hypothetical protein